MSKDPSNTPSAKAGGSESLEDAIYRPSLSEGNTSVRGTNPLTSLALTLVAYAAFGGAMYWMATQTKVGKAVVKKTVGIDLSEEADNAPPPPPPPPPPPAPPAAPAPRVETARTEAPPPPPPPGADVVPEVAPREMPKQDLSLAYATSGGSTSGTAGSGVAGGGVAGTGMAVAGSQGAASSRVVDFTFDQMKIKVKPPAPPYPPIARMAKIQGTVVVEIIVDPQGVPVSAKALEGPPQLRPTAENYAMQWRFEPAMQNGQAVQSRFKLTMPFKLM